MSKPSYPNEYLLPQIRKKSSHQRSLEEKQWVALDILINKESYKGLSAVENEELQLNDEYKTDLRAEDVNRILELPREIQLALPHLRSASEVHAHKILTTYTLEHGEAEIAKADEQSQDHMFVVRSGEVRFVRCSLCTFACLHCLAIITLVPLSLRPHKPDTARVLVFL